MGKTNRNHCILFDEKFTQYKLDHMNDNYTDAILMEMLLRTKKK